MTLDRFMDDFGRDLSRAASARSRRRRRYLRLTPVIPVAAALTLALVLLPAGGGGVDAIAAARAALDPKGEIVHMKIELLRPDGRRLFVAPVEQWYAADPVRWRTVTTGGVLRNGRLRPREHVETAFARDRLRDYDRERDVVTIRPAERVPADFGPTLLGGDPASDLRAQLGKGDVRDDGVTTVDGRQVRRLVREAEVDGYTQRFVYYMDPATFAPVGGHVDILRGKRTFHGPAFTITGYERLPRTAANERLLRLPETAKTRYVWK